MAKIHSGKRGLVFVLSNWGDAHQLNRMLMFEKCDLNTFSLAYEREYYPSKVSKPDVSLGKIKHGHYLRRVFSFLGSLIVISREIKSKGPVVYVFGLDNLVRVYLAKKMLANHAVVFYEISDIRYIETGNSIFSRLLRMAYRQVLRSVDQLIVTSPEFVTGYLSKYVGFNSTNHIVMENKVHASMVRNDTEPCDDRHPANASKKIIIGYFGLLRCNRSLEILLGLTEESDKFHVVLRGMLLGIDKELEERVKSSGDISFYGPYLSPEDLGDMYNDIDVSWICYPHSEKSVGNWQWARTNRYYEAGFFRVPMIAASHTIDGNNVLLKGIGWCIDLSNPESAKHFLHRLTRRDIRKVAENYSNMSQLEFQVSNDYEQIVRQIHNFYE